LAFPKNWKTANPAAAQRPTASQCDDEMGIFATGLLTVREHHPGSRPVSKPKMKLLVLAQTPPPLHGQSAMVRTLVTALPPLGIELHHVNLRLSRDAADIGRWRPGKLFAVLGACGRALGTRFRHGGDTLYYIPAPAKRGALYRDWLVMLLCRPFFRRLVLHWHAAGLGEWLRTHATAPERWLTQLLLGRADLALVLGEALRADATVLRPRQIAVVRNGIPDPCPGFERSAAAGNHPRTALFVGLGLTTKGVFDALAAVRLANQSAGPNRWRLVVAGDLPDPAQAAELREHAQRSDGSLVLAGFVSGATKHELFARADVLVFPTYYPAETQGLVVAEALAYDLPVIVTDWRAVAENLPDHHVQRVAVRSPAEIATALAQVAALPPTAGHLRDWYLQHYTVERHLAAVAAALGGLERS
jgi:glycosyltransferase involved in cell wall biosynthesis